MTDNESKTLSLGVDIGHNATNTAADAAKKVDATIGQGLEASAKAAENIAREARGALQDGAQGIATGLGSIASAVQGAVKQASDTLSKPAVLATGAFSWLAYVYVGVVLAAVLIWPVKDIILQGMATWERQQTEIRREHTIELEAAAKRDARIRAESEAAKAKSEAAKAASEAEAAKTLKDATPKRINDLEQERDNLKKRTGDLEADLSKERKAALAQRDEIASLKKKNDDADQALRFTYGGVNDGNLTRIFEPIGGGARIPCWHNAAWYFIPPTDCERRGGFQPSLTNGVPTKGPTVYGATTGYASTTPTVHLCLRKGDASACQSDGRRTWGCAYPARGITATTPDCPGW